MPDGRGPLHGLRVVEAATLFAGPMVGTALGEYGAEVIKVEAPASGDPMRTWARVDFACNQVAGHPAVS